MSTEGVDMKRRRMLIGATSAISAVGVGFVAVPFIKSMQPSAKAQAAGAPVEVDISKLEPGQMLTVEWRGKPVWVVYRTEENLKDLPAMDGGLRDPNSEVKSQQPEYAANPARSIKGKEKYAVLVGICTHLGCSPTHVPLGAPNSPTEDWKGGFFCPCHGSRFDLAGRVAQGVPAPTNLVVPPHAYLSDTRLIIGVDQGAA
ncbi:ubiquinol-cytochrome c reductase iron-sulfur subunit [Candidatus Venteria ishoeyi]|uniref:ubiquinol-cytochrome c reductase iron-sulfur subunit n=1 Tax=Candidatus Venteria ishoeyi TaxID=1899563 RepID=UPI0025A4DCEF|nr:ubiquinol-cytochrome c reductase iron-sulfur subunit [Candidatus Venteria ishoeyi]MDM8546039.1 ubiquinol-cytochrome c reductase iron-sulfur subunit [Candidatus Venteria ishoeyi]